MFVVFGREGYKGDGMTKSAGSKCRVDPWVQSSLVLFDGSPKRIYRPVSGP